MAHPSTEGLDGRRLRCIFHEELLDLLLERRQPSPATPSSGGSARTSCLVRALPQGAMRRLHAAARAAARATAAMARSDARGRGRRGHGQAAAQMASWPPASAMAPLHASGARGGPGRSPPPLPPPPPPSAVASAGEGDPMCMQTLLFIMGAMGVRKLEETGYSAGSSSSGAPADGGSC